MRIEEMVSQISTYLEQDPTVVREKLEREIFNKGISVAEAWNGADPQTASEIAMFYRESDAFLYDLIVEHHTALRQGVRQRILDRLITHRARTVLDYGGGIGLDAIAMFRAGLSVTYFEVEGKTAHFAERLFLRENCGIRVCYSTDDLARHSFDAVVCIEVLEHVQDPLSVVAQLHSYLADGGTALVSASFGSHQGRYPSHLQSNAKYAGKLARMMESVGFGLTFRFPDEKPLEFTKVDRGLRSWYLRWKRRWTVGQALFSRGLPYIRRLY